MPLQTGQILLNKYHIDRMLGEGGFGYVYEATDLRLNRKVAIKELRAELSSNKDMLDRFVNEARAIAALNNPHIVMVLSFDSEGDHYYMTLEFMDGGSLANLLAKRGKLLPAEAAIITKSVCDGLAAAHRLGIVHRDIKPANILLMRDGQVVKISDFGIAHVPAGLTARANLTRTGMTMGTPWYMSPEQARGERVDARSDLYSVGVMLYEMVAGSMYLDFSSDFLRDVEKLKTTPPRPLPSSVPPGLQQIIARALAKDPASRYQSAEEMSAALQKFVTPGATISIPTSTDRGRTRVSTRPPSGAGAPLLPLMLGVVLVAVAVIALVIFSSMARSTSPQAVAPTSVRVSGINTEPPPSALPPTVDLTAIVREVIATQAAVAQANQATETAVAQANRATETAIPAKIAATLSASAPTATRTPTPTLIPSFTPTATPSPPPTQIPQATPTRGLVGIQLVSPPRNTRFNVENPWITLEWKPNPPSFVILADNEWYRVQVFSGRVICNFYTKDTVWTLPPSGQSGGGCDPGAWQFNTMQLTEWRVSLVVKVDNVRDHDIEKSNSEGWSFRWNK